jgi:hypothetical protein
MSDISTLKEKNNLKTFHLILLAVVTMGLYLNIWMYKTAAAVEDVTRIKTMSTTFLIVYLGMCGIAGLFSTIQNLTFVGLGFLLIVVAWFVSLAWCFRVRRALRAYTLTEHNFEFRMNRFYSVLFTFYHVNYCINALPRDKQKHEDKKPSTSHSVQA